jgi:hypothetical protein
MHGMSDDAKLRTAAGLSFLWDGEPLNRMRAGDGAMVMPGRRLAIHLMAQPDVAAIALRRNRKPAGEGFVYEGNDCRGFSGRPDGGKLSTVVCSLLPLTCTALTSGSTVVYGEAIPDQPSRTATSISIGHRFP